MEKEVAMRKIKTSICTGVIAIALAATSITPAIAGPSPVSLPSVGATDVQPVQYRSYERHDRSGWHDRRDRLDRRDRREWRGHRGFRDRRAGYRRHSDGYWYPLAAFGAAAIIGNAIANGTKTTRVVTVRDRAAEWCAAKYRSYRAYDNTYQPYNGPRRQCTL